MTQVATQTLVNRLSFITTHARRLALPLLLTSASVGASMMAGDAACQYIQFNAERKRILESYAQSVERNPSLPMPDVNTLLAAPTHFPDDRLPSIPSSLRSILPPWWNSSRGLAMFATGLLAGGPWQFTLQRTLEHTFPGRSMAAVVKKMGFNMGTAPISISATFYLINYFQGGKHEQAIERIQRDVATTYVTGFLYCQFPPTTAPTTPSPRLFALHRQFNAYTITRHFFISPSSLFLLLPFSF